MVETYKNKFNKKHGFKRDVSHSIKEIASLSNIKYNNALKIVKKGEGAFYTNPGSVRKQITSARAWGVSRLYSAVMGGKAAKIDEKLLK